MATISEIAGRKIKCPICSSSVREMDLGRLGVSKESLQILKRHVSDERFNTVLQLVDITMRKIDPDKMAQESEMKRTIAELTRIVNEVKQKLDGTAIGKVGEVITIKELKTIAPIDTFSEAKAHQGTDIVASVRENNNVVGKVAISVKYDLSWKSDFIRQLRKNMKQEQTNFGILVTKIFPHEALNDKAYVEDTSTGVILVVKTDYIGVAYYGYRQGVIAWNQASTSIDRTKDMIKQQHSIFKKITDWLNGNKFRLAIKSIDEAISLSNDTDALADNLQKYTEQKIHAMQTKQKELRNQLALSDSAMQELKNMLKLKSKKKIS